MSELKNFEKLEAATFENLEIGFSAATLSYLFGQNGLQCDYYNRHLDKTDQSDYRKITIHSKKVSCEPISSSKRNNKLLEAQNLNIDGNAFQKSKIFH